MTDPTPSGEVPQTVEEAIEVLHHHKTNGNGHHKPCEPTPWHRELRGPLWLIGLAAVCAALALVLQSVVILRNDTLSDEEQAREDCYQAFTNDVNMTASATRRSINDLLIRIVEVETMPGGPQGDLGEQVEGLTEAAIEARRSGDEEQRALRDRQDWLQAGQMLPCPVDVHDP